jgi:hypothetical protein
MNDLAYCESARMCADMLDDVPEVIAGMSMHDLLGRVRGMGPRTIERLLGELCLDVFHTVGSLTPRQRALLSGALRARAAVRVAREGTAA